MEKLLVRLHGKEISQLELHSGEEYLLGRGEDCAVVLPVEKGISRHHIKVFQQNGEWCAQILARFGTLVHDGQSVSLLPLKEGTVFSAPPFEMSFIVERPQEVVTPPPEESEVRLPTVRTKVTPPKIVEPTAPFEESGNSEATVAGRGVLTPYLRVVNKKTGKEEVIKLEGHLWVAGRESTCEIHLDEGRASRRHFEISKTETGFFITDLDSANGTLLNDEPLTSNEPWQLTSGDVIRVASVKLTFEVRDSHFASHLPALAPPTPHRDQSLPVSLEPLDSLQSFPAIYNGPTYENSGGPAVVPLNPPPPKVNKVKFAIMALTIVLLYGLFNDDSHVTSKAIDPAGGEQVDQTSTAPSYEQLGPEKRQAIKNSFNLATNMYKQTKYELCVAELQKLHEIVPSYENSRELLIICEHGRELLRKKEDADRRERERVENERAIIQIVEDCKLRVNPKVTVEEIQICLAPAIERSPEHPQIQELLATVRINVENIERRKESIQAAKERTQNGQRMFEKARALYKSGELAKALAEYEKFLRGNFSDLGEENSQAQRETAQVRKELNTKVSGLISQCKEQLDKSQYKSAYNFCVLALKEDPKQSQAQQYKLQAVNEMKRELKSIYEDSVLEESMGNIDTAKEKWKQILDRSIPNDEYYTKAKRNLQKYGIGQ